MNQYIEKRNEKGFTLIELLVAIVVVGILTAVAIVGIAGLTDKGNKGACNITADAARAASAVHYANSSPSAYPQTFGAMQSPAVNPPELELAGDVTGTGTTLTGKGWVLTLVPGATPADAISFTSNITGCP